MSETSEMSETKHSCGSSVGHSFFNNVRNVRRNVRRCSTGEALALAPRGWQAYTRAVGTHAHSLYKPMSPQARAYFCSAPAPWPR